MTRKTVDVWHIDANYGQGWEHETTYYSLYQCREDLKAYRDAGFTVRVRTGRQKLADMEPNEKRDAAAGAEYDRSKRLEAIRRRMEQRKKQSV